MKKVLLIFIAFLTVSVYGQSLNGVKSLSGAQAKSRINAAITQTNTNTTGIATNVSGVATNLSSINTLKAPPYCLMHFADSSITISLTEDTWAKITNSSDSLFVSSAVSVTANDDSITISSAGVYKVDADLSLSATNGDTVHFALVKNDTVYLSKQTFSSDSTEINVIGLNTIATLAVGDDLTLRLMNSANNDDAIVKSCDWAAVRLNE